MGLSAITDIAPHLGPGTVIATKSTVPIGSAESFQARFERLGATVPVVSNPENHLYWDRVHPTTVVHGFIARLAVKSVIEVLGL